MQTKYLVLLLLLPSFVTGCSNTVVDKSVQEIPNLEAKLAQRDGRADSSPYVQVLDAIETKCYERNRTALASMAIVMAKMEQPNLKQPINDLDALKLLYSEASTDADASNSTQVACADVLSDWRKIHQEEHQEEAKEQEYDHVMNAGEN